VEAVGTIHKVKDNMAIIVAAVDPYLVERQKISRCLVKYDDGRHITAHQRKKVYAILGDIAEFTGNIPEYEKELQKCFFIARYGGEDFSLSDCSVSTAREFISYLIDFCFENNIGTRDTLLNNTADISRYLYSCLANLIARGYEKDRWIYEIAESIIMPDIAFFLDVPVETAVKRVRERPNEKERYIDMDLQYKLRNEYIEICKVNNCVLVSSLNSIDDTYKIIKQTTERILK